ncbi:MAG: hypothetical protein ACD_20C00150G0003 [uncultured bacterium]|nr:MAG: hypothetical protein ACD_20C00150G0003 [uncultured bacterium]
MTGTEIFQIAGALFLAGLVIYAAVRMSKEPKAEHK